MLSSKNIAKSLRGFARLGGDYYRAQTMYEAATTIEKQSDEIAALRAEVGRLCVALKLAQTRAADYDADIEAGRLVRLPVKPGDPIWWYDADYDGEAVVKSEPVHGICLRPDGWWICNSDGMMDKIGTQYAMLTEESARAALGKEREYES